MRLHSVLLLVLTTFGMAPPCHGQAGSTPSKGVILENLTWVEAGKLLGPDTVVVIPLGVASKEHGPHLPLNTDWLLAEYYKRQVVERARCVMAPTVPYFYYATFKNYPGSTTLGRNTATHLISDICRSYMQFGVRRFYVLNTGVITIKALKPAQELLSKEGAVFDYSDPFAFTELPPDKLALFKQSEGTHADEWETSEMLNAAPAKVDMSKAVKDIHPEYVGGKPVPSAKVVTESLLTSKQKFMVRDTKEDGFYSPTGVYGDATLATPEKGKIVAEAYIAELLKGIEKVRSTPLPKAPVTVSPWPVE